MLVAVVTGRSVANFNPLTPSDLLLRSITFIDCVTVQCVRLKSPPNTSSFAVGSFGNSFQFCFSRNSFGDLLQEFLQNFSPGNGYLHQKLLREFLQKICYLQSFRGFLQVSLRGFLAEIPCEISFRNQEFAPRISPEIYFRNSSGDFHQGFLWVYLTRSPPGILSRNSLGEFQQQFLRGFRPGIALGFRLEILPGISAEHFIRKLLRGFFQRIHLKISPGISLEIETRNLFEHFAHKLLLNFSQGIPTGISLRDLTSGILQGIPKAIHPDISSRNSSGLYSNFAFKLLR